MRLGVQCPGGFGFRPQSTVVLVVVVVVVVATVIVVDPIHCSIVIPTSHATIPY